MMVFRMLSTKDRVKSTSLLQRPKARVKDPCGILQRKWQITLVACSPALLIPTHTGLHWKHKSLITTPKAL